MLNLDKLDNMELSAKQDLDWKSLMQLCEVSRSDVFNGIYTAYKYGFQRGQTAERSKNKKKPRPAQQHRPRQAPSLTQPRIRKGVKSL